MKVSALVPGVTGKVRFSLADKKRVPDRAGCYALITADNDVLYVGQATSLCGRLDNHTDDVGKRELVSGMRAAFFAYVECSETEVSRVERGWMNQHLTLHGELPPLNKVYSPVR
jgi:excinuclease UvrABC nuclease subunit